MNSRVSGRLFGLLLVVVLLGACAVPPAGTPESAAAPGQISVSDARAQSAPMAGGTGAAFLVVHNGKDQPLQLVSASSPAADVLELHETVDQNGVMRMVPHPEGLPIAAGGTLELKPGGKHVMLIGLVRPLVAGTSISLTLTFSPEQTLDLTIPVVEIGAMPEMESHSHEEAGAMHEGNIERETGALIETLPIDAVHELSEALDQGSVPPDAEETLINLLQAADAGAWPEALQPIITEIRTTAEALQIALKTGDLAAATPLAEQLHGLLHALEMAPAE